MVVGNWKMHKTVAGSVAAVRRLSRRLKNSRGVEILIAPSFTALRSVGEILKGLKGTRLRLAAQNVHWEEEGAFTGEVSPVQLKEAGCRAVLVGHSERRRLFGETDEIVHRKVFGALKQGLSPVLCVGETLEQRKADMTAGVLKEQLGRCLAGVAKEQADRIIVAYEPVWAIGTGQVATAIQISEVHGLIRQELAGILGHEPAERIRILYGGSVTPENIEALAAIQTLDGVLVGGASLKPDGFAAIVKTVAKIKSGKDVNR